MRTAIAGVVILMSVAAASAQTAGSAGTGHSATAPNATSGAATQPNTNPSASNEPLRQQVRDNLAKAGFTDIKVMPTSFMVRAKDQSGNPVMMVINPDSFTEVTAIPAPSSNAAATQNSNSAAAPKH